MNLRSKLILGFLFSAILVAVVGYISHSQNRNIRDRLLRVNSQSIYLMEYTGEMATSLHNSLMYTREYLDEQIQSMDGEQLAEEQRKERRYEAKQAEEKVRGQLRRFEQHMKESLKIARQMELDSDAMPNEADHDTLYSKSMIGHLQEFHEKFKIYESLLLELFKLSRTEYRDGKELLTVTLEPFFKSTLMPLINTVRTRAHQRVDRETASLEQTMDFALQTILFVSVLAVISAMLLGYAIYRQISDPLNKLTKSARRIGAGHLDERIEIDSDDEIGTLAGTFNQMVENLDKTTVSKNYFDNIIESLSDALVVIDPSYNILKVNQALIDLTGYEAESLREMDIVHLFERQEQERIEHLLPRSTTDVAEYIETVLITREGSKVQVSFTASPLNEEFTQGGYVCLISDITERKEAEEQIENSLEEKKVLLAEIHHRVKNNLAVISSLLQMQLHNTENETVRNLLQNSVLRIQSIALIHEKLYQTDTLAFIDYEMYLEDLIETIENSFSDTGKDLAIETDLTHLSLSINQAIPCSLFINEVIVNSFKHAFENRESGKIFVTLEKENEHVYLEIRDNGEGLPDNFEVEEAESLGMTLLHTLTKQLSGDLQIYNDDGVVCKLEFPIE